MEVKEVNFHETMDEGDVVIGGGNDPAAAWSGGEVDEVDGEVVVPAAALGGKVELRKPFALAGPFDPKY